MEPAAAFYPAATAIHPALATSEPSWKRSIQRWQRVNNLGMVTERSEKPERSPLGSPVAVYLPYITVYLAKLEPCQRHIPRHAKSRKFALRSRGEDNFRGAALRAVRSPDIAAGRHQRSDAHLRSAMFTYEDNAFRGVLFFTVILALNQQDVAGKMWRKIFGWFGWEYHFTQLDRVSPMVYIILSSLPLVSAVDSEYSAAAFLVATVVVPLQQQARKTGSPETKRDLLLNTYAKALAASVLLAISFRPGLISLLRIDEDQKAILRKVARRTIPLTVKALVSSARLWGYLSLLAVFSFAPSPSAPLFVRIPCLVAKVAAMFALEFTKSIGYRTCTEIQFRQVGECWPLAATPSRIFQVYSVLIELSCVLLMDRSFETNAKERESDGEINELEESHDSDANRSDSYHSEGRRTAVMV